MMTINLSAVLMELAVLSIASGGLALVIQARSLCRTLFLVGFGLLSAAASPSIEGLVPTLSIIERFTAACALAGLINLAAGRPRIGMALLWPVICQWIIWPMLTPCVLANWIPLALITAPFSVFILIWLLQRLLTPIYGERAASHVTGEYLVRTIDAVGRLLGRVIALPFRLIFR